MNVEENMERIGKIIREILEVEEYFLFKGEHEISTKLHEVAKELKKIKERLYYMNKYNKLSQL